MREHHQWTALLEAPLPQASSRLTPPPGGSAGREAGAYFTDAKELPLSGPFQAEVLREVVTLPRVGTRQLAGYKIMTPEDQQQLKAQLFAGADSSQVLKLLCPA